MRPFKDFLEESLPSRHLYKGDRFYLVKDDIESVKVEENEDHIVFGITFKDDSTAYVTYEKNAIDSPVDIMVGRGDSRSQAAFFDGNWDDAWFHDLRAIIATS